VQQETQLVFKQAWEVRRSCACCPVFANLLSHLQTFAMHLTLKSSTFVLVMSQVFMAFLASVTVLYAVFPFFTFAPSSGWLGPELPHVLFFARIFAGKGLHADMLKQMQAGLAAWRALLLL
jgi:hypothetical protein